MNRSPFDLTGKVALVTGAGRGLGKEIAMALAAAGADVRLGGRTVAPLEAAAEQIMAMGGTARPWPFDLADETATRAAVQKLERLDILPHLLAVRNGRRIDGGRDGPTGLSHQTQRRLSAESHSRREHFHLAASISRCYDAGDGLLEHHAAHVPHSEGDACVYRAVDRSRRPGWAERA